MRFALAKIRMWLHAFCVTLIPIGDHRIHEFRFRDGEVETYLFCTCGKKFWPVPFGSDHKPMGDQIERRSESQLDCRVKDP